MELIKRIINIEDSSILHKLEEIAATSASEQDILSQIAGPIQATFDLEAIKREQNYQPVNKATLDQLIEEADIQESIEELLEMARA
ncbi:MAG: hypothetical protein IPJ74_25530 [Saprospiraceae bacterium]|nr:hypothetical protein [Saprospiraceae bacterium]